MDNAPHKAIGKNMMIVAWVLVLGGLAYFFAQWESQQYNPNQNLGTDAMEVVLQRNRFDHYVATGAINGVPVVFLLDTGATDVAIPKSLAEKIGLRPGRPSRAITANGIVEVHDTTIDRLQLGSIQLRDIDASINPGMIGDEVLLGMSALKDLEFTQSGNTLTIRQI